MPESRLSTTLSNLSPAIRNWSRPRRNVSFPLTIYVFIPGKDRAQIRSFFSLVFTEFENKKHLERHFRNFRYFESLKMMEFSKF